MPGNMRQSTAREFGKKRRNFPSHLSPPLGSPSLDERPAAAGAPCPVEIRTEGVRSLAQPPAPAPPCPTPPANRLALGASEFQQGRLAGWRGAADDDGSVTGDGGPACLCVCLGASRSQVWPGADRSVGVYLPASLGDTAPEEGARTPVGAAELSDSSPREATSPPPPSPPLSLAVHKYASLLITYIARLITGLPVRDQ